MGMEPSAEEKEQLATRNTTEFHLMSGRKVFFSRRFQSLIF
jgi:hypothetical protein